MASCPTFAEESIYMKIQLLIAFPKTGLRWFILACLLTSLSFGIALAQGKGYSCEPSPDVKGELKKIDKISEEELPFKLRQERQLAMSQELLKKRSEEHTSELQSLRHLVCRLLLEKKKK